MPLQTISFEESRFDQVEGIVLCDQGTDNTFDDSANTGAKFIIVSGTMAVLLLQSRRDRFLFFTRFPNGSDCPERENGKLRIEFDSPQVFVRFNLSTDFVGPDVPMLVNFFADLTATNLIRSVSLTFTSFTNPVTYNEPNDPVRVVVISTRFAENILDNLSFSDTPEAGRHDVAIAFDGSGSMAAQDKWRSMIEAGDIFVDLYSALGDPADTFGGVLFRWDCARVTDGSLIVDHPTSAPLSSAVDLPTLFAVDTPQGCTPIGEGVVSAAAMVNAGVNGGKSVLLLTDGINNRGRPVSTASTNDALDTVTVHTIGIGSGAAIDPVAIAALAESHGGNFQQTTNPAELLDYFARSLGQILGKAEFAVVQPDDTVFIASGTTRAVFLIAWDPAATSADFDLRHPDGTVIDHTAPAAPAGITARYVGAGANSFHAFFVVDGADLGGAWAFVGAPTAAHRIVVEDLALRIQWSLAPKLGLTGTDIVVRARITNRGEPFRAKAKVSAVVTSPDASTGDILAQGGRNLGASSGRAPDRNLRAIVAARGMKLLGHKDVPTRLSARLPFRSLGDGEYELRFRDTNLDGIYRFELQAQSTDEKNRFHRGTTLFSVLVSRPAEGAARLQSLGNGLYRAVLKLVRADKKSVGPFLAPYLVFRTSHGKLSGRIKDHLDGTYSQLLAWDGKGKPQVTVEILGWPIAGSSK